MSLRGIRVRARVRACLLLVWLAWLVCLPARADTALSVFQSFRGTVNFTGTEATLRNAGNNSPCTLVANGSVSAVLKGIPSGATVLSAQLYWAASGTNVDTSVNFDGVTVNAGSGRSYKSATIGSGYNYYSAAADVTSQVAQKGNGTYSFSGLSVSTGSPWCDVQGVMGGFALVVVYSSSSEPFRMLNIYEGFQYFRYNGLTINLGNFNVPNPLPSNVTGRIGHITWEGDSTLSGGGESLFFNNTEMTDSMNPSGNQFNSASNITGDANSYGIDFDVYTLTSPTIQPGQSSATTTYETGQDLVLLSAEIVAMPYVANADLALTMTRSGDLTVGSTASYAMSVSNNGVDTEVGPVTIVDTLPSGLKFLAYAGAGWSCGAASGSNGTTVVTCSQNGPLASNATMSALTLSVTATASGNFTNSATVSGKTGDNNASNNTATNTYTMPATSTAVGAMFTREVCTSGQPIVVAASDTGCHAFSGWVTAGDTTTKIYLTAVSNSNGKPYAAPLASSDTTVGIDFLASCLPNSGVTVSYAGLNLGCAGTVWQTANVTVKANQATASNVAPMFYADVGRVTLSARYQGTVLGSVTFISRPYDIRVRDVIRSADNYSDLNGVAPTFAKPDVAFARAGDPFLVRLGAWMLSAGSNGSQWAPSFGKEASALQGTMDSSLLAMVFEFDEFAVTSPQASPVLPLENGPAVSDVDAEVRGAFVINQPFAPTTSTVAGAMDANVSWFEAGNLALTPSIDNYLGTGQIGSPPTPDPSVVATPARLTASTRVIGRFYPDHFVTDIAATNTLALFDCLPAMNCPTVYDPTKPAWPVSGAIYANQPFSLSVIPYGLSQNGKPAQLKLFQNVPPSGVSAPMASTARSTLLLSAVKLPNGAAAQSGFTYAAVPYSSAVTDFPALSTTGQLALPPAFDASNRLANNWGAPTLFYVRASMTETRGVTVNTTQQVSVNSIAASTAPAGTQYEDGLLAMNGRLQVGNALGAETLRLPVTLTAQYWSGSAWLTNTNDSDSLVAATVPAATPAPTCTRTLAASATSTACKAGIVTATNAGTAIRMNNGKATLVLQAPGRPNVGSIDYQVTDGASAPWLPSTRARATFGLYKSPVIYLREVY